MLGFKEDRQTDILNLLIFESTQDNRTNNVLFHSSFLHQSKTYRRIHYISFHSSYLGPSKSDKRTNYILSTPYIWVQGKQTDTCFILSLMMGSKTEVTEYISPSCCGIRKTETSFHPSYWDPHKTDGQTTFHFTLVFNTRKIEKLFHFTPNNGVQVKETDGVTTLQGSRKTDRRTY